MNDLELLRKYEPIIRFTKGESFFPSGVEEFLKHCSLWIRKPDGVSQVLVPAGKLDADSLVQYAEVPDDHTLYLRFVDKPLEGLEYQRWLMDPTRERFVAPGRLARVPLIFRIADSLFDLSFFVRGKVPGGFAAAAGVESREMFARDPRRVYFGRAVRSGGWIGLQYLFFYPMNDWRSSFFGVNDHESDWEQIFVFLYENENGNPEPLWAAYASHDFKGDDLRRRWDDPMLVREGDHPVVFAGAGSHASYFEQGEYLMGAEPQFIKPVKSVLIGIRKFWYETLGMGREGAKKSDRALLSVPFIDYARGDGKRIGPGQDEPWSPELISDQTGWVHYYRGLWGLDTRDPIGGERAPAGPKYNRDGTVRQSWYDPIGWAGLDKIYPPDKLPAELGEREAAVQAELQQVDEEIGSRRENLRKLALDVEALKVTEYTSTVHRKKEEELRASQKELQALQTRRAELVEIQQAIESYQKRVKNGDYGPPGAHIRHVHHPEPPLPYQHRAVEVWAALSGALVLMGILALVVFQPAYWPLWLIGMVVVLLAIEAITRRVLTNFLLTIAIILAIVASGILIYEFWHWILAAVIVGIVLYMIQGNLRELRR